MNKHTNKLLPVAYVFSLIIDFLIIYILLALFLENTFTLIITSIVFFIYDIVFNNLLNDYSFGRYILGLKVSAKNKIVVPIVNFIILLTTTLFLTQPFLGLFSIFIIIGFIFIINILVNKQIISIKFKNSNFFEAMTIKRIVAFHMGYVPLIIAIFLIFPISSHKLNEVYTIYDILIKIYFTLFLVILYEIILLYIWNGYTITKKFFGIRVINIQKDRKLSFFQIFIRTIIKYIPIILFWVFVVMSMDNSILNEGIEYQFIVVNFAIFQYAFIFFFVLLTPLLFRKKQFLHDYLAHTDIKDIKKHSLAFIVIVGFIAIITLIFGFSVTIYNLINKVPTEGIDNLIPKIF